ncbi:MAG: CPBP family intramembrane metalloprotease [Planctomycetes bacterium]|nr:CPBP family intramembrane metalloprotease [Planctomycetota bacterium]
MPAEFTTEAVQMLTAGGIVASVAVPIGLLGWVLARSRFEGMLPSWKPWRVPWGGFEVLGAFVVVSFAIPMMLMQSHLLPMAVGVVALPIQLAFLALTAMLLFPQWKPRVSLSGVLPVAVLAWLVLTPLILLFHACVIQIFTALQIKPDEHPLAKFGGESVLEQVLFMLQACVAAPLIEEILFRGVLLTWTIGARDRTPGALPTPPMFPPEFRPWMVMIFAVLFSATGGKLDPVVFVSLLATGLAVVWMTVRRGKRHICGVYATAAMFAMVHSSVWPSPIPLFLLGLGLGWCAVRTRGVLVPAIVHGLFNAVSAVFVLRGGTG